MTHSKIIPLTALTTARLRKATTSVVAAVVLAGSLACELPAAAGAKAAAPVAALPECRWADGAIVIDGNATEPAWAQAQVFTNFHLNWLGAGDRPAKTATRARLLWDNENFYFSADMEDSDLFADVTQKDGDTWNNDVFEIFLKPTLAQPGYYEFHVSAANTQFDLYLPKRGGWLVNRLRGDHPFHMESKVTRRGTLNQWRDKDQGWTVEGRIPWTDFQPTGGRPAVGAEWRFALCRYDYSVEFENPESSSIAPYTQYNFHQHEQFLPLKFVGLPPVFRTLKRQAWLDSKVIGSPEPPAPYITERAYPKLDVKMPLAIQRIPGTDHMLYLDHNSTCQFWVFEDRPDVVQLQLALRLTKELTYGFAFHPKFRENGYLYTCLQGPSDIAKKRCAVVRYVMDKKPPFRINADSLQEIISWESNGHNGADVAFGLDGMLYITSGDGTSDSDMDIAGQDMTKLLAKVLRIDVDHPAPGKAYSVPKDNPFLETPGARPETWAHGFRNPWRITVDAKTGDVWVGENGQDLWESAKRVERGANYGWSVYEGSHPFYMTRKLGPGKLTKPTVEHHHREARSLTGGVVYHGAQLPGLQGAYVYGDYSTGKIWGARHDGKKLAWHQELTDTSFGITGFGTDTRGGLMVLDDHSGMYYLKPNPDAGKKGSFPRQLSQTGLFTATDKHLPHPALVPYSVNAPHYADGATKVQYIALPGEGNTSIPFTTGRAWDPPEGTVLVQTLSLGQRRIETRLMTKQQKEWAGYTYEWNAAQTDAVLVDKDGADRDLQLPGGAPLKWRIPSRAECMMCHSRAANYVLGLNELQMNKTHNYGDFSAHQFEVLSRLNVVRGVDVAKYQKELTVQPTDANATPARTLQSMTRLVDPADKKQDLTWRVRSYWSANCAHCHVEAGGGNSQMELGFHTALDKTRTLDVKPYHQDFGLGDAARLVAPGSPGHSVMLQRIMSPGPGRMPPVGPSTLDGQWVELLVQWIAQQKK